MDIQATVQNFLDEDGRVMQYPSKRKKQLCVLVYLAGKFEPGKDYTEKEVNELLLRWHCFGDPATLRRELYDHFFFDRARDGSVYRLAVQQPTPESLGL